MKILIRMPNWIGDAVMATPVLERLRAHFPHERIAVIAKQPILELLGAHPAIDELLHYPTAHGLKQYEIGLLLTNSFSSAWHFWKNGVGMRIGFAADGRSPFLHTAIAFPKDRFTTHLSLTYQRVLMPLGLSPEPIAPRLYGRSSASKNGCIVINPCASFGEAKCWPKRSFAQLADELVAKGYRCVFIGNAEQRSQVAELLGMCRKAHENLAGQTTLSSLMDLLQGCALCITNDSGPMHLADALGAPVVSIFGSTEPKYTGPFSNELGILQKKPHCAPCFRRVCPIDFRCMHAIRVEDVVEKACALLEKKSARESPLRGV